MILILLSMLAGVGFLIVGTKFYRSIDWSESAEPSPDWQAMRRREADLQHIQDVLAEAHQEGKLSKNLIEEFGRYCEAEIRSMKAAEQAWRERCQKDDSVPPRN